MKLNTPFANFQKSNEVALSSPFSKKVTNQKSKNAVCVYINFVDKSFDFISINSFDNNSVKISNKKFTANLYSEEFYKEFTDAVRNFAGSVGSTEDVFVTLLLPNNSVSINSVNVPNINRKRNEEALNSVIEGFYKNKDNLYINSYPGYQTKQISTFSVCMANKEMLDKLAQAMTDAGMPADTATFASNGLTNAVTTLVPALKSSSYLMLDIKEESAMFSFVCKGRTAGFYELPFGYSILGKNKLASEDMLFDHSIAELAVLNAKEKAKAKQLTIMREENIDEDSTEDEKMDAMFGENEDSTVDPTNNIGAVTQIKSLPKKQPRKLPKFMLRELPKTEEEYGYENFRIFMKWALNIIQSNDKLSAQGLPEKVIVNMPENFSYIIDMVNTEKDENEYEFSLLSTSAKDNIKDNLELFGGLFAGQFNKMNNF